MPKIGIEQIFPGLNYVPGSSIIHNIHPVIKLLLLVIYSIAVFSLANVIASLVLFALLLAAYFFSRLGLSFFLRKLRFILLFGFMIVLVQVLTVHRGYLLIDYTIFNSVSLKVWSEGVANGIVMMLRFVNVIGSSYLFVITTDPNKLVYGLMQAGLPYRHGFMLITSLRFIPVFEQEVSYIKSAQMAKGIDLEGVSIKKLFRAVKYLLTPLVISALSKVDYLAISMESRAFGLYPTRSYLQKQPLNRQDWLILFLAPVLLVAFFIIYNKYL